MHVEPDQQKEKDMPSSMKKLLSPSVLLPGLLLAAVLGQRLWMNVRPPDPLPPHFSAYSAQTFETARKTGGVILVDVYAVWCPTCKAQNAALQTLMESPKYAAVTGMRVNYDTDNAFLQTHQIRNQSTLIVYRGQRELSRTIGVTSADLIKAQLDEALLPGTPP